jgi:hypothetical protein
VRRLLLLAPLALLVVACGSSGSKPFMPGPTSKCLREHHYTTSSKDTDVGLIASAAPNGGLRVLPPEGGNTLVVAFGTDATDATSIETAYRRVAPPKLRPHLGDVMTSKRNAVLVWTVSPTPAQQQTVLGCLSS